MPKAKPIIKKNRKYFLKKSAISRKEISDTSGFVEFVVGTDMPGCETIDVIVKLILTQNINN